METGVFDLMTQKPQQESDSILDTEGVEASSFVAFDQVSLSNFRSYGHASIHLSGLSNIVVLTGENGAGKTNVLEAISFYAPGRGMRSAGLSDICKVGANLPWAVSAVLNHVDNQERVGTGLDPDGFAATPATLKRIARVDGETVNPNVFASKLTVGWLTPQMDRLFAEAPSSRRNFLDRMVLGLYPDHSRQVGAYERVMRERNKLLVDFGVNADAGWLKVLEARMAEHATAIALARLDFTGQLAGLIEDTAEADSAFPKALLALDGELEGQLNDGVPAADVEEIYRASLGRLRSLDAQKGRANSGPHKTDLIVTHAPKSMPAGLCSTGEQKALLINLILANARLTKALNGIAPILLLDEIVAHLDEYRRAALFDALIDLGGQCWLTGTDADMFSVLKGRAQFFTVTAGKIQAVDHDKTNKK